MPAGGRLVCSAEETENGAQTRSMDRRCAVSDGARAGRGLLATLSLAVAAFVCALALPVGAWASLPDNRLYEQVSPANKDGSELDTALPPHLAAEDGNAVIYTATGAIGSDTNGGGPGQENISRRLPGVGWLNEPVDPRHLGLLGELQSAIMVSFYSGAEDFRHVYLDPEGCCTGGQVAYSPEEPESGDDFKLYSSESPFAVPTWIGKPQTANPIPPPGGFSPRFELPKWMVAGVSPEGSTMYFNYSGTLLKEDEEPFTKNVKGEAVVPGGRSVLIGDGTGGGPWGFYEWNNNTLSEAGALPNGELSQYGAITAAEVNDGRYRDGVFPEELDGQVSQDGKRVFFVSPDPQGGAPSNEPPELYMRETLANGEHKTILVSRDPLLPKVKEKNSKGVEEEFPASAPGGVYGFSNVGGVQTGGSTYAWASPDGSHVFFASPGGLSTAVPAHANWSFFLGYYFEGGNFKLEVTTASGKQTTAPIAFNSSAVQVQTALEALSNVGTNQVTVTGGPNEYDVVFPHMEASIELTTAEMLPEPNAGGHYVTDHNTSNMYEYDVETEEVTYLPENEGQFAASSTNGSRVMFIRPENQELKRPAGLALLTNGAKGPEIESIAPEVTSVTPARAAGNGSAFLFYASGNSGPLAKFNNGGYGQFYHYDVANKELDCVSCPPGGVIPSGPAETNFDSHYYGYEFKSLKPVRMMSEDGTRVFFQSPDPLVGADINGNPDVYEWENGHRYVISGGNALTPSHYMDNSRSGGDVFFETEQGLVPSDEDEQVDVYDARIPRPGDSLPVTETPCSGEVCQGPPSVPQLLSPAASATFEGLGNIPQEAAKEKEEVKQPTVVTCKKGFVEKSGKCVKQKKKKKKTPKKKGKKSATGMRRGK